VEIEKIRVQEQEKQIAILKRENEAVKEKLKKAEEMSQTLQNCLKELTDEKHELLDSIEELNEEKAELEEARLALFVCLCVCLFLLAVVACLYVDWAFRG
jgi:type IV secretory pathway component VirB8